ncbi:YibE/F family protein [Asanoa sp. WMMD1127]|uniref:YibE/F family protein n=1 Tax=Asanoa sp. WMMD1127 TaxID=3016107 RepID=UPI0024170A2B|nr:YibE/F family protein [Asanoa sp. WMMD1127]MDG4826571.1 YibE/F family protein [Asanoa sp. WMMD1127]
MGHDHQPAPRAPRRLRIILAAILVPAFLVTGIATALLWPGDVPKADEADPVPRFHATVTKVVSEACPPTPEGTTDPGPCGVATVRLDSGADQGQTRETDLPSGPGSPRIEPGDAVIVTPLTDAEDPTATVYTIADHQRGSPLLWLVVAFAAAIVAFGRWRGLAALAGLAVSFAVLLGFVLPAILGGGPPLLIAVTGAALIMFVVLYLTHGISAQTSVAVLGTLASLVLAGGIGTLAIALTHLTGYGDENAITLSLLHGDVDLHGLLLAGIIIGSLGVLDDVTVTQAATVGELARANPSLSRRELYRGGTRVGRAHIASTVNTIVLAYAGASLPVLLLVVAGGRGVGEVLTAEFIAQEIVRSVVGTLGLIAAVPITTALAAFVATAAHRPARAPRAPKPRTDRSEVLAALAADDKDA